jgi:hypothetical protein
MLRVPSRATWCHWLGLPALAAVACSSSAGPSLVGQRDASVDVVSEDTSVVGTSDDRAAPDDAEPPDNAPPDAAAPDAAPPDDGAASDGGVAPGWTLVAIDTPLRTYLDYVEVPASGAWTPEANGWPILAQWENQTTHTAIRFQAFTPGATLTAKQIVALLPILAVSSQTIDITAPPYNAGVAPADATSAIQGALYAAGAVATQAAPVDVLVPAGTFQYSAVLSVPHDVRLRRWPEDTGGTLVATNPTDSAVHLTGDRSGALFLVLQSPSSNARLTTPWSSSLWVGGGDHIVTSVSDTLVVGNDVSMSASAHVIGLAEHGGLWAFNQAHDGYADTFHHTGGSSGCQVVGNRAEESATRGDDFYAFVGYAPDGDPVHHCTCIANWGRNGPARGLSAVGGGFISFQSNDIAQTQAAGIYLAQEDGYGTFGTFDVRVLANRIAQANLGSTHDGLLAFSDSPTASDTSTTFGTIPHEIERLTIQNNDIRDTAAGMGHGYGIEIRSSADTGDVTGNTLTHNQPPQLVVKGTNFAESNNTVLP